MREQSLPCSRIRKKILRDSQKVLLKQALLQKLILKIFLQYQCLILKKWLNFFVRFHLIGKQLRNMEKQVLFTKRFLIQLIKNNIVDVVVTKLSQVMKTFILFVEMKKMMQAKTCHHFHPLVQGSCSISNL